VSDSSRKPIFTDLVLHSSGPALVDFYADWCGLCRAMAPVVERVASDYIDRLTVGTLNVDIDPRIAMRFGVRSNPTLIFFVDGEAVATLTGVAGPGEVKSWAAELMKLVADGSESWRPPQSALPSRDEQNTGNEAAPWTSEIEPLQTLAGFEAVRVGCMAGRVTGSRRKSHAWVQDQETSSPPTSLAH
jgi:thioredoxin 1